MSTLFFSRRIRTAAALALALGVAAAAADLRAATNDLAVTLQKGLFEEEANHNLEAAMHAYQAVAQQYDKDRKLAATAIYRLGECHRKQGDTNGARSCFERALREFSDQPQVAAACRAYLGAGNGGVAAADVVKPLAAVAAAHSRVTALQDQIERLKNLPPSQLWTVVQQEFPNAVLTSLMQQLLEQRQRLAGLQKDYALDHPEVVKARAVEQTIVDQINDQMTAMMLGLKDKLNAATKALEEAETSAAAAPVPSGSMATDSGGAATTSEEAEEIRRIAELIKNSPDLINARSGESSPLLAAAEKGQVVVAGFLLKNGATPEVRDDQGNTPLILAASKGHRAMVELLLDNKAGIDARNSIGFTALQRAAEKGFKAIAETLLARGASVQIADAQRKTPLHWAAQYDRTSVLDLLLAKGAATDLEDSRGATPLALAAGNQNVAAVQRLLAGHANPNAGSRDLALTLAANFGNRELVELLLTNGADPNLAGKYTSISGLEKNSQGLTPLRAAIAGNRAEIVRLLIRSKAKPNASTNDSLVLAALDKPGCLAALLDGGASPDVCDEHWQPALVKAVCSMQTNAAELLLSHHANVNQTNAAGGTALHFAVGQWPLLEKFVAAKGDANARDQNGQTPLHWAAGSGSREAADLLLKQGADVNARDAQGNTPLHLAVLLGKGGAAVAERLLAGGGDPNVRNNDGQTPLDYTSHRPAVSLETVAPNTRLSRFISLGGIGGSPIAYQWFGSGSLEQQDSDRMSALLKKHGAVEDLPRDDRVELRRSSAKFSAPVFVKGALDWNRFTLLELLAVHYKLLAGSPEQPDEGATLYPWALAAESPLSFPDLARLRLRRVGSSPSTWGEKVIDITRVLESGRGPGNENLRWGDVVEIPEVEHSLNTTWPGFSAMELAGFVKGLTRQVQVVIKGRSTNLVLSPKVDFPAAPESSGRAPTVKQPAIHREVSFWLRPVLRASGLLLTSSDLSRIKIVRKERAGGAERECVVDCRDGQPAPDLWLQDGDRIEVPEK